MMSDLPLMELKDIHKSFGNVDALKGVSISIKAGECHCLLGDNGAGKSTFINILGGLVKKNTGKINICGINIDQNNVKLFFKGSLGKRIISGRVPRRHK